MRKLTIYDKIEPGKIYQFSNLHTLDMFKRRSMSMSQMANDVGMNSFQVIRCIKQSDLKSVYITYQTEYHGPIRSAYIEENAVAFLSAVPQLFEVGEAYRAEACNKANIITRWGQRFWEHVGVHQFFIDGLSTVPNPDEPKLRLATIQNHHGYIENFSININEADLFTAISGFSLPKPVDNDSESVRVKALELAPIRNEEERLAAIKLLESVRYESMS